MSTRFKDEFEDYAIIIQPKGNCRFDCKMLDQTEVLAKAKGSLIKGPKKEKLGKSDIVLLQQDISSTEKKYYIVHKYNENEVKILKKIGEIPRKGFEVEDTQVFFENEIDEEKEINLSEI